jgi:hypothetical protein
MLPVKSWTVFYADLSTFNSSQGTWAEAPAFGVSAVVYYHLPEGTTLQMDSDVYYYVGNEAGGQPWKMGLWTDSESYWRVHDLVSKAVTP